MGVALLADQYRTPSATNSRIIGVVVWIIGIVVLLGSFLITFWLTTPESLPPVKTPLETFKRINVSDTRALSAAAALARLKPSANLKGYVDQISRDKDGKVKVVGWALDLEGSGTPIIVLVFASGNYVFETHTKGPLLNIQNYFKVSDAVASNVAFEGTLACPSGAPLSVIAVTEANTYSAISHPVCP
jgi:hypothetical protein